MELPTEKYLSSELNPSGRGAAILQADSYTVTEGDMTKADEGVQASGAEADKRDETATAKASTPEILTEDLLRRLLASSSVESYLAQPEVKSHQLTGYLSELLESRGLKRADVVRGSGLNATVVYDIFAGKSKPGKDNAVMLAFGLGCDLTETQRLLRLAGAERLWCKDRRDAVLIWCIEHGFTREQTDDELYRLGERTLLKTGRLQMKA